MEATEASSSNNNNNIFDTIAVPSAMAGAMSDLSQTQLQQQHAGDELEYCLLLRNVMLRDSHRLVPMPPLYSVSKEKLFQDKEIREELLALMKKSGGKLSHEIGLLLYEELFTAYTREYELDNTTSALFECLLCYLPLMPELAVQILTKEISTTFTKLSEAGLGSKQLSLDEMQEKINKRRRAIVDKNSNKQEPIKEKTESTFDSISDLLDEIAPFLRLGTLYKKVVPIFNAKIQTYRVGFEIVPDRKQMVRLECLRVFFANPVIFQLVGRKCISPADKKLYDFPTVSTKEAEELIKLLQTHISPCDKMQFWDCVSVCTLKIMKKVNGYDITRVTKQKGLPRSLAAPVSVEMSKICDPNNKIPFFIFVSSVQVYIKPSDVSTGKFTVRIFPSLLENLGDACHVLSFDEERCSEIYESFDRLIY